MTSNPKSGLIHLITGGLPKNKANLILNRETLVALPLRSGREGATIRHWTRSPNQSTKTKIQ